MIDIRGFGCANVGFGVARRWRRVEAYTGDYGAHCVGFGLDVVG